jgi:hypothetical protein
MATLAYLTAPWSLRVVMERHWRLLSPALFCMWVTVDGSYAIYWRLKDPAALVFMRDANFPASLPVCGMCGLLWFYQGPLKELFADARALIATQELPGVL